MATALTALTGWDPAVRTLTSADTAYSLALANDVKEVTIWSATECRYRVTDGAMGVADAWMPILAGGLTTIAIDRVSHGASPVLYLATGGTSVIVKVLPSPVRGS